MSSLPSTLPARNADANTVGRIPIRNLWLLMLYASDLFRTGSLGDVAIEEAPDDLPDLAAEFLLKAVDERQRRRLTTGLRATEAVLHRVRGRIDLLATERGCLLDRGSVACRFDELTVDTPRNRYVLAALQKIAVITRPASSLRCRALAHRMRLQGVVGPVPTRAEMSADRIGRNDADDRTMLAAAKLAFDFALVSESSGTHSLWQPDREERWVRRLFEKAVGGLFALALPGFGWTVRRGLRLDWPVVQKTNGIERLLPDMQTDIVLDHPQTRRRIVIDTKFTSIVTSGWHRDETLRSGYLYQIYAYLRSQAGGADPLADRADGLLLHPSIGIDVDEAIVMQGHQIRFATVDLTQKTAHIRAQLMRLPSGLPSTALT
jgi:5-methylcytosine-specific restriction enzyme subunit McrC